MFGPCAGCKSEDLITASRNPVECALDSLFFCSLYSYKRTAVDRSQGRHQKLIATCAPDPFRGCPSLLVSYTKPARPIAPDSRVPGAMPLWSDLLRVTGDGGEFEGWPNMQMMVMLQHLRAQHNMRFLDDGTTAVSETLSGLHERTFRYHFSLSGEQYSCITQIYDSCDIGDIPVAYGASIPPPVVGVQPVFRRKCFTSSRNVCCNKMLRVRYKSATVYERDSVYPAWMIVKSCRDCGARYLFDRRILRGVMDSSPCAVHLFNAWSDGEIPEFVASKSAHSVFSTSFLGDAGISLVTMRCV